MRYEEEWKEQNKTLKILLDKSKLSWTKQIDNLIPHVYNTPKVT